ncbi:AraC family transcriptional regulator [Demequina sp. NBRC 110057]|uniref:AraC family transcriptional regulator n=1 Tax=Demequina sp. NBRC 110057 TaxID=1570346 RepID=UPI000A0359AD|nr:AraC family transcriptional regulator [Demequina sp. NBRC 110057]
MQITTALASTLTVFEADHCFDPELQPALTASVLRQTIEDMPTQVIHELCEPLGMAVALARWGTHVLIVGPYTHEAIYPETVPELVRANALPRSHAALYRLYRTRYAIVDAEYAHRGASAALRAAGVRDSIGALQRIMAAGGRLDPDADEARQSASLEVVEERYRLEQRFMDAIADGSTHEALDTLARLSSTPSTITYLTTPYLGTTILRIMARVAAQRGGVPGVTIDAISQEYAQRLHRIGHTADARRSAEFNAQMISAFSRAVRRHQRAGYPPIVRRALDEIELHLSQPVSPTALAARIGVSTSTLTRRFKDATGTTIAKYVAERRVHRATRLLATTSRTVRDIAAYVGYDDANYFVKVFRQVHGVTPTSYRSAHAHAPDLPERRTTTRQSADR